MTQQILLVFIILLVVTFALYFVLRLIFRAANKELMDEVANQLQTYDELLKDKELRLSGIVAQIDELNRQRESLVLEEQEERIRYFAPLIPKKIKYCSDDFLGDYHDLRDAFGVDKEAFIKEFLKNVSMDFGDEDKIIDSILEKLNFDNTYSLMLIDEKEQEEIVRSILEENEIPYLERFEKENCDSDVNNFKTGDFVYFLKLEREKVDKTIVITTSDKNDNFDYISPNIKTVYDEKLCEGFMISYGREVIDYSVHYSDLVG